MSNKHKHRLDWHSGFEGGLRLSFRKYADDIEIEREHTLSKEPLRIDFLVVKKKTDVVIDNDIGRCFRTYNIIEYKNPNDELNIDVLWKCIGYCGIYKSMGRTVDAIRADEITISVCRSRKPVKLLDRLKSDGYTVKRLYPGVYKIGGIIAIPMMIVVLSELHDNELGAFKIMTAKADENEVRSFLSEASRLKEQEDKSNADAVLQISTNVNKALYERIRGEEDMCEALRELMADDLKQAEERGLEQGIEQGIERGMEQGIERGMDRRIVELVCKKLRKGKDVAVIADELEESESTIEKICNVASKFAPDYDEAEVYREYSKI